MDRYHRLQAFFKVIMGLLFKIEVTGLENLPLQGPYILAVNHVNILEPPVVFVSLPVERITVMAADKWEKSLIVGPLLKTVDPIFVNREQIDLKTLKACLKALKNNEVLGIAPEGTRSKTGALMRGKPGVAYLAAKGKAPVIPIGVSGHAGYRQKWLRLQRPRIRVRVGHPINLKPIPGLDKAEELQAHADQIMVAIARLIDPELRGVYAQNAQIEIETDTPQPQV